MNIDSAVKQNVKTEGNYYLCVIDPSTNLAIRFEKVVDRVQVYTYTELHRLSNDETLIPSIRDLIFGLSAKIQDCDIILIENVYVGVNKKVSILINTIYSSILSFVSLYTDVVPINVMPAVKKRIIDKYGDSGITDVKKNSVLAAAAISRLSNNEQDLIFLESRKKRDDVADTICYARYIYELLV